MNHQKTIWVKLSCFVPEFTMTINVPDYRDAEEYIDEFLEGAVKEEFVFTLEWDFVEAGGAHSDDEQVCRDQKADIAKCIHREVTDFADQEKMREIFAKIDGIKRGSNSK